MIVLFKNILYKFNKMAKNAIKRILQKDMKSIEDQQLNSLGIYVSFNEENIREAKALIISWLLLISSVSFAVWLVKA